MRSPLLLITLSMFMAIAVSAWIVEGMTSSTIEPSFLVIGQSGHSGTLVPAMRPFHVEVNTPLGVKVFECQINDPGCLGIRNAVREIIGDWDANKPELDKILNHYKIKVRDTNMLVLFPRPE